MEGYFDIKGLKEKKFLILTSIAKDLGMENAKFKIELKDKDYV